MPGSWKEVGVLSSKYLLVVCVCVCVCVRERSCYKIWLDRQAVARL